MDLNRNLFCWKRRVGVYLDGRQIHLTEVGKTWRGLETLQQASTAWQGGASLRTLLQEHLTARQRARVPVCIGLSPEQTFFMTSQSQLEKPDDLTAESLLEACHYSNTISPETVVMDCCRAGKGRHLSQLWSLAACQRPLAEELFETVTTLKIRDCSLRPGPWPLASMLCNKYTERSWKTCFHVLMHDSGGLVLLVINEKIALWRPFKCDRQHFAATIVSTIRTVMVHAASSLNNPTVAGIVLHGPGRQPLLEPIGEMISMETKPGSDDELTPSLYSYLLACSAGQNETTGFDLFKSFKSKFNLLTMFPLKLAVMVAVIVSSLAFFMAHRSHTLNQQYRHLQQDNDSHRWAQNLKTAEIKDRHKKLQLEVSGIGNFLSTRIFWSNYLRDLPTYLPANACLSNLFFFNELKEVNKKKRTRKSKKFITLRGVTLFPQGRAAPQEIESYLESLRQIDLLKKDFPNVEIAEIKWRKDEGREVAMFTVIASP